MDRYQLEHMAEAGHKGFLDDYQRARRTDMPTLAVAYTQLPTTVQEFYMLVAARVAEEVERQPVQDMQQLARLAHQTFLEDHFEKQRQGKLGPSPWGVAFEQLQPQQQAFYVTVVRAMAMECGRQLHDVGAAVWDRPW